MDAEEVVAQVKVSNLRGLGGAGFPTGVKWGFIPRESNKPKYLVVNADEGEPGTFKDRYLMEKAPHLLLEGTAIAGYAIGSHRAFIYIRGEYGRQIGILEAAIKEAYVSKFLGDNILGSGFDFQVSVYKGAGAYICGEETALLESLEGKKGWPRLKPPFPASVGLYGCPTIVNNVETLCHVPNIIANGPEWFASLGSEKNGGTRLFGVSGHVVRPGLYELPMGTPLRKIIFDYAGGVKDGKKIKAVIPGGSSCPVLTAQEIDVNMDFDSLAKIGSMLGSAGVIVMDEETSMVDALHVIARFYAHESCGQCTACREGTGWIERILHRILQGEGVRSDPDLLLDIANNILGNTICPLGDAAALPVISFVSKFREEFEFQVSERRCDSKRSAQPLSVAIA
jgi:NADH-quinone oxidoreductase subunit F